MINPTVIIGYEHRSFHVPNAKNSFIGSITLRSATITIFTAIVAQTALKLATTILFTRRFLPNCPNKAGLNTKR
jgi:hypothetical protein